MNRAYYDQSVSYGKDCEIVTELMKDIQENGMDYHHKPIVLIGMVERDYVPENQLGELGSSFFSHDDGNYGRMISFMNSRGYGAILPSTEQMNEGYQISFERSLNSWPMENSIVETENEIIIKLSEPSDKWFVVNGVVK